MVEQTSTAASNHGSHKDPRRETKDSSREAILATFRRYGVEAIGWENPTWSVLSGDVPPKCRDRFADQAGAMYNFICRSPLLPLLQENEVYIHSALAMHYQTTAVPRATRKRHFGYSDFSVQAKCRQHLDSKRSSPTLPIIGGWGRHPPRLTTGAVLSPTTSAALLC